MRPAVAYGRNRAAGAERASSGSDALFADAELAPFGASSPPVTPLTRDVFDSATAERRPTSFFAVATSEAFGALTRLELTRRGGLRHLRRHAHADRQAAAAVAAAA